MGIKWMLNERNEKEILKMGEYVQKIKEAVETRDIKKLEKNTRALERSAYKLKIGIYYMKKLKIK